MLGVTVYDNWYWNCMQLFRVDEIFACLTWMFLFWQLHYPVCKCGVLIPLRNETWQTLILEQALIELTTKKNKTTRIERIRKSNIPHRINKKSGEWPNLYKNEENAKKNTSNWTRVMDYGSILFNVISLLNILFL